MGEYSKAEEIASKQPPINECREIMLAKVFDDERGNCYRGEELLSLLHFLGTEFNMAISWNEKAKNSMETIELIEAVWLFDMKPADIDIVVHRQSVVHSLVEYCDNSVIAQLGVPDMRIPIQYALTYPNRIPSPVKQLSLTDYGTLTFEKPDYNTFGCINICKKAIAKGGLYPAAANSANEAANLAFRQGKIKFLDIERLVGAAAEAAPSKDDYTLADVNEIDAWAREYVASNI